MNQADRNTEGRTGKVSILAITSAVFTVFSLCLWVLTLTLLFLRWGHKVTLATLCYTPVILMLIAFVLAITAVAKITRNKGKVRGYELAIFMTVLAAVGFLNSLLFAYGYIRLEGTGNRVSGHNLRSSPNKRYLAESAVGCVRGFWGDWEDRYSFAIYEIGSKKPKYFVQIERLDSFDKKCFFPNGIGQGVSSGGAEGWQTTWSSDSSVVTFGFQDIELKLNVSNDEKPINDQKQ